VVRREVGGASARGAARAAIHLPLSLQPSADKLMACERVPSDQSAPPQDTNALGRSCFSAVYSPSSLHGSGSAKRTAAPMKGDGLVGFAPCFSATWSQSILWSGTSIAKVLNEVERWRWHGGGFA
jgi:hypothetical protein